MIKQTSSEYPVADAHAFYCRALESLRAAQSQFLVGGAFAFHHYTGIERDTKDFDIFVRPRDRATVMNVLSRAGYHVELSFHWLGKAFAGDHFIARWTAHKIRRPDAAIAQARGDGDARAAGGIFCIPLAQNQGRFG